MHEDGLQDLGVRCRQMGILLHPTESLLPGLLQKGEIADKIRYPEVRETRLPRPHKITGPPEAQIRFGDLEPVRRLAYGLQPFVGHIASRPTGDEKTVRFLSSPPHPSAELMKLGKTEALCMLNHHQGGIG